MAKCCIWAKRSGCLKQEGCSTGGLEDTLLSEMRQLQKDRYGMISLTGGIQAVRFRDRKLVVAMKERGNGKAACDGHRDEFGR